MKKTLTFLAVLTLAAVGLGLFAAYRDAVRTAADWEAQLLQAQAALESAYPPEEDAPPEDPISAFFRPIPYAGGTARYLASLETDAWQAELLHAAALLKEAGEDAAFLDAFLDFVDRQAQEASDAWSESLTAQGAATAGAWAHVEEARIPPYRFGALSLIAACQRAELAYAYQFSPEETRQELLENGFQEDLFPN